MAFKTYKMNDMSGKHGIVCMGLLMLLSSCHDDKQVTASGLQRKDLVSIWNNGRILVLR